MAVERLYLMCCGHVLGLRGVLYQGGGFEPVRIPLLCALLIHPEHGPVIVDTGYGPQSRSHVGLFPEGLGRLLMPGATRPEWDLRHYLDVADIEPSEVAHGILTHLHNDHTGGICDFLEHTTFTLAYEELRVARGFSRLGALLRGFTQIEFPEGLRFEFDQPRPDPTVPVFERSHDLFGDGSIRLIPTPGHTAGHRSVWVRLASGREILLLGDACYHTESYRRPAPPGRLVRGVAYDPEQAWATVLKVRRLARERPDVLMIPCHDFDLWPTLRQFPEYYQ